MENSNFHQLLNLRAQENPEFIEWLRKRDEKYTSPEILNELLEAMAPGMMRQVSANSQNATFFTIMADETADVSNKTGGDNSNKRCFGTKPKLLRESGNFSGNRDTWKFFRETRDNSGTLQKKNLRIYVGILKISGKLTQKFGRMIQISGTTYVKTQ